jgi:alpha-D-ribose 1-methylphosphonate 5-triphosphate diphosphatase
MSGGAVSGGDSESIVIENARVVLADAVIDGGWVAVEAGRITEVGTGRAPREALGRGIDFQGDLLTPGLIELHTDHLEQHLKPRPNVRWPALAAVIAYDAQIVASGITTVFDSLRMGSDIDYASPEAELWEAVGALETAGAQGLLRAEHRTHLRCEICAENAVEQTEKFVSRHPVDLISLMDHTPGARQFRQIEAWKTYYGGKTGLTSEDLDRVMEKRLVQFEANHARHRAALLALARSQGVAIASHDDATPEHVAQSIADGVAIAEFPTTAEAAGASHAAGIAVLMGAPNVVRGGSHSGNVAAEALARAGMLDILSSDYVPAALLMGAFELARRIEGYGLPAALRTVTLHPARATGLDDRGQIAAGMRADLLRIRLAQDLPVVREVYRGGRRVI